MQLPLYWLLQFAACGGKADAVFGGSRTWQQRKDSVVILAAVLLWLGVMGVQSHKEERFMFPIYPLLCFLAAFVVREAIFLCDKPVVHFASYALVVVTAILSLSRVLCLILSYSAPVDAFLALNAMVAPRTPPGTAAATSEPAYRVCIGKEWYRFPSSYFLLDATEPLIQLSAGGQPKRRGGPVELAFIKSDFTGQLPQAFVPGGTPATASLPRAHFNDLNAEEPSRYVSRVVCCWGRGFHVLCHPTRCATPQVELSTCDYVVDIELPAAMVNEEPYFNASQPEAKQFVSVWSQPYLHNPTSPFPYRSMFIPGVSTAKNSYGTYHILANTARVAVPSGGRKAKDTPATPAPMDSSTEL